MLPESCLQVGKLGLEGEIERFKHEKCALAAEVVRLQQLQESSKHEIRIMINRVQSAEKRQEQMMNFLAKAIKSPAFLAQLVQQTERLRLDQNGRKRKHLPSGTEQPEELEGEEEPQVLIETGEEATDAEEEIQGLSFNMEKGGVPDELHYAGRFDLSSRNVSPSCIAMLMGKAGEGQSTMFFGITPQDPLVIGAKNNNSFDSAITTRLDGTLEDASDGLDLDFDLHNFIEEIIPTAENSPPGNADVPDAFWGDFIGKPEVSGAHSGSNNATAVDSHPVDRATTERDH